MAFHFASEEDDDYVSLCTDLARTIKFGDTVELLDGSDVGVFELYDRWMELCPDDHHAVLSDFWERARDG